MGIMVGLPSPSGSEKDLQLNFGKNMTVQVEMRVPHLPAEWHMQSGIQLTWPHAGTDWAYMLAEVQECFINIAREIAERELLLIVTPEPEAVREQIASSVNIDNVRFLEKADDNGTLTIDGTGSLEAYGGNEAAGIGSRANNNVRNIVINGGTITAECTGRDGAGIGGGHSGKAENIRINGGVVTATGGEWGYGIGSGYNEYSLLPTTITITGGTVKAIAGKPGAAIGALASANDLTMTGGSLTVQKFENSWGWIISPSSTIVEVDKNSLTGAITYLNQDGKVEDTANWDITVNETAVNGVNYKDILGDGALCYDIEKKTLTAKERINYVLKVRAPETDVILNGGIGARSSLTIGQQGDSSAVGAHDVTVTSDRYDAI